MNAAKIITITFVAVVSLGLIATPLVMAFRKGPYPDLDDEFRPIWLGTFVLALFWVGCTGLRLIAGIAGSTQ